MTDTLTAEDRATLEGIHEGCVALRLYDAALARAEAAERNLRASVGANSDRGREIAALRARVEQLKQQVDNEQRDARELRVKLAEERTAIDAAVVELSCSDDNAPQALTLLSAALGKAGQ